MSAPPKFEDIQLLTQFSQMIRGAMDTFMDRVGVHRGQGMLLCAVADRDGATQSEIADMLSVQGATVTNMLQKLEESGFVARRRDSEDNRLVRVYMTDEGRVKEQEILSQIEELHGTLFANLNADEIAVMRRLIAQMMGGEDDGKPS